MARRQNLFTADFLANLQQLVGQHHTVYPNLPPQGLFFEALVEQAFFAFWMEKGSGRCDEPKSAPA
jgi:hypothetical protein